VTADTEGESVAGDVERVVNWTAGRILNHRQNQTARKRLGQIDAFHTYTDHVETTYGQFGYPREKIQTIGNILDESFLVDESQCTDDVLKLLYVGRLAHEKGADKLLQVYERVAARVDGQVRLSIAGTGALESTIEREIQRQDLADGVSMLGYVPYEQMPEIYASHDVLLSPQVWDEPFGRTYIEALACGTPVVASDTGAAAEILGDAGVVTDGSSASLADAVVSTVADGELELLAGRARRRARRFHPNKIVPQFEALYERLSS
jgi:glycosyltransferase involved in cell wall biosynthesis